MSTFITALENEKDYSNPEDLVWQVSSVMVELGAEIIL